PTACRSSPIRKSAWRSARAMTSKSASSHSRRMRSKSPPKARSGWTRGRGAVPIATECTLRWDARAVCLKHKFPFTTSYHTQFPEYVTARFSWIPLWAGYRFMHAFHANTGRVMVATPTMQRVLEIHGFKNTAIWSRGVDVELFHPSKRGIDGGLFKDLPKPIFAYVGRVSVEKNIEAFLKTDLPGSKVVVGGGPAL